MAQLKCVRIETGIMIDVNLPAPQTGESQIFISIPAFWRGQVELAGSMVDRTQGAEVKSGNSENGKQKFPNSR
jgi:hypothetical protein